MRLNPEADAEALAHAGLLVPLAPQVLTKEEAQPVTASGPVTAQQMVSAQAGTQAVSTQLQGLAEMVSQLVPRVTKADTPLPALAVAGGQATPPLNPPPHPPPTAGLVGPSGETAPPGHLARNLTHGGVTASVLADAVTSANTIPNGMHAESDADQRHHTGREASEMTAVKPGLGSSKHTEGGFADSPVVAGMALLPPNIAMAEGTSDMMTADVGQNIGQGVSSNEDRLAKRQTVAVAEPDLACRQNSPDTPDVHHEEGVAAAKVTLVNPLASSTQEANDCAVVCHQR